MWIEDQVLAEVQQRLGYTFAEKALLALALTHSSAVPERMAGVRSETAPGLLHNERLEFLGDAVLELVLSEALFSRHPEAREGILTNLRSNLVNAESLSAKALELGLDNALLLGKGELQTGGRGKVTILSGALEAVIGAVHLDGGMIASEDVVLGMFAAELETQQSRPQEADPLTRLQHFSQARWKTPPTYHILSDNGPSHERTFTAAVSILGRELARGSGTSKKAAKQEAALRAWQTLETESAAELPLPEKQPANEQ